MLKVEFTKEWEPFFEKHGLKSFEDFFSYSAGETINRNKKRNVVAFALGDGDNRKEFFMKRFFRPYLKDMFFTFRNFGSVCSQAACEWKSTNILLENGIDTYRPVCYGQDKSLGVEKRSFLITAKIAGQCLTDFIPQKWGELNRTQKENLLTALAEMVRKIHAAKISLPDLYLWHIFITGNAYKNTDGKYDFAVIDLHRMRINVTNKNERIKNLGAFYFSMLDKYFDDRLKKVFLDAYTGADQTENATILWLKIKRRLKVLASRRRKVDY